MNLFSTLSAFALPATIAAILIVGITRKVRIYEVFTEGAKDGFTTSISLIPHLVAMMVAVSVFRSSGALQLFIHLISPLLHRIHFPAELVPLALLRPISGSGSLALVTDLFKHAGPDSFLGRVASTMQGSTDTTLYVLTVYYGSVGIRNPRYSVKVGLLSDLVSVFASLFAVHMIFGK
ncbi:spore maturation protein [Sulfoacidibacillus thermotolerans]|uniref:Spore maturation protein n=1 Tax=Sulfoacidibacillus thermotolerans TaxID=1765684 RepID=A0A2U3D5Q5_SULT2|nr:spore maturation protein [Sulfoacidibacillus thermotolerans]PWI56610.1 spore maturation protein [Sulfoacidibacillus thermotolerans]